MHQLRYQGVAVHYTLFQTAAPSVITSRHYRVSKWPVLDNYTGSSLFHAVFLLSLDKAGQPQRTKALLKPIFPLFPLSSHVYSESHGSSPLPHFRWGGVQATQGHSRFFCLRITVKSLDFSQDSLSSKGSKQLSSNHVVTIAEVRLYGGLVYLF